MNDVGGPNSPKMKKPYNNTMEFKSKHFDIDADASEEDIKALVAQSQKRSAVFDIVTNPTNVTVEVN